MEFFQGSSPYYHANNNQQFTLEKRHNESKTENFVVDDLLDFPTDELVGEEGGYVADVVVDASTDSSTAIDSCNSSLAEDVGCRSFVDTQFSNICVPYNDFPEFEWLSKFEEESFSSEEVQKLQLINGVNARSQHAPETHQFQSGSLNRTNNLMFSNDMTIPGKTRTKRSRVASSTWASRLLAMSPNVAQPNVNMSSNSESGVGKKNVHTLVKDEYHDNSSKNEDGRKCLHCATSKTPQWRSGPMGPKTLCNACGVRYKSGRLVPEYRPASSPTFVLTKHSNSHRKVIELRRQKEMQISQHHQQQFSNHQNIMLRMPNGDDYLVHQHMSHDYRQLI